MLCYCPEFNILGIEQKTIHEDKKAIAKRNTTRNHLIQKILSNIFGRKLRKEH